MTRSTLTALTLVAALGAGCSTPTGRESHTSVPLDGSLAGEVVGWEEGSPHDPFGGGGCVTLRVDLPAGLTSDTLCQAYVTTRAFRFSERSYDDASDSEHGYSYTTGPYRPAGNELGITLNLTRQAPRLEQLKEFEAELHLLFYEEARAEFSDLAAGMTLSSPTLTELELEVLEWSEARGVLRLSAPNVHHVELRIPGSTTTTDYDDVGHAEVEVEHPGNNGVEVLQRVRPRRYMSEIRARDVAPTTP